LSNKMLQQFVTGDVGVNDFRLFLTDKDMVALAHISTSHLRYLKQHPFTLTQEYRVEKIYIIPLHLRVANIIAFRASDLYFLSRVHPVTTVTNW
jgi:hypothetical protein